METLRRIVGNIEKVMVGKREVVELVVCAAVCGGHVLIEDVPGVGKTSLANALAKSMGCSFKRVQFTPDVLPSDVTGFSVYNPKTGDFDFKEGAVMANIVLADEINRTSPKTQAALLEAMEEGMVTVDGVQRSLPQPFVVLATQNPIEYVGTYPLPEAQLDRFFMRVSLGYPSRHDEVRLLGRFQQSNPMDGMNPVVDTEQIVTIREAVSRIYISPAVNDYIVCLANATRNHAAILLGASPRASIALSRAAQTWAFFDGRDFVVPDDVVKMLRPVWEHRLTLKQEAKLRRFTVSDALSEAVKSVRPPL